MAYRKASRTRRSRTYRRPARARTRVARRTATSRRRYSSGRARSGGGRTLRLVIETANTSGSMRTPDGGFATQGEAPRKKPIL